MLSQVTIDFSFIIFLLRILSRFFLKNFILDSENFESRKQNCIVYDCPEFNITSVKQYESMFHYYSMYAKILRT